MHADTTPGDAHPRPVGEGAGTPVRAEALASVVDRLYDDLRAIAERHLRAEGAGHTLQPTALVHEAYLKLLQQRDVPWDNPAQALGLAAQAMRRVLVDHARGRGAAKRGGMRRERVTLENVDTPARSNEVDLLALEDALQKLALIDAGQARIVELRFFGGLTCEQVSDALSIPKRTIDREWAAARAWLYRELGDGAAEVTS